MRTVIRLGCSSWEAILEPHARRHFQHDVLVCWDGSQKCGRKGRIRKSEKHKTPISTRNRNTSRFIEREAAIVLNWPNCHEESHPTWVFLWEAMFFVGSNFRSPRKTSYSARRAGFLRRFSRMWPERPNSEKVRNTKHQYRREIKIRVCS